MEETWQNVSIQEGKKHMNLNEMTKELLLGNKIKSIFFPDLCLMGSISKADRVYFPVPSGSSPPGHTAHAINLDLVNECIIWISIQTFKP